MNTENTGTLTGGGADSTGKFGEIIGFMEAIEGFSPQSSID